MARHPQPATLPVAPGPARHHRPHWGQPTPRSHAAGGTHPPQRSRVPPADLDGQPLAPGSVGGDPTRAIRPSVPQCQRPGGSDVPARLTGAEDHIGEPQRAARRPPSRRDAVRSDSELHPSGCAESRRSRPRGRGRIEDNDAERLDRRCANGLCYKWPGRELNPDMWIFSKSVIGSMRLGSKDRLPRPVLSAATRTATLPKCWLSSRWATASGTAPNGNVSPEQRVNPAVRDEPICPVGLVRVCEVRSQDRLLTHPEIAGVQIELVPRGRTTKDNTSKRAQSSMLAAGCNLFCRNGLVKRPGWKTPAYCLSVTRTVPSLLSVMGEWPGSSATGCRRSGRASCGWIDPTITMRS